MKVFFLASLVPPRGPSERGRPSLSDHGGAGACRPTIAPPAPVRRHPRAHRVLPRREHPDTRATPRDAYRFAKGEPLGIQPFDEKGGAGERFSSIVRSTGPPSPITPRCSGRSESVTTRSIPNTTATSAGTRERPAPAPGVPGRLQAASATRCGAGAELCYAAARSAWKDIQAAAEEVTIDRRLLVYELNHMNGRAR